MALYLASSSPRRKELLTRMGLEFTPKRATHDETLNHSADPADEVARISILKAEAVRPKVRDTDIIIAADTMVVLDGLMMGKPRSEPDAFSMLRRLSGRKHQVMTGLTVMKGKRSETTTVVTTIRFRSLSDEEIRAYIATGEPMDKAGAYGIQGLGAMFVIAIEGDYYNVMGLPVCTLSLMLRKFGVKLLGT